MNAPLKPAHSPFGGCVAARVLRCPASVGLVEKVPAHLRKSSAYADRGTALHAAMALSDRTRSAPSTTSSARRSTATPSRATTSRTRCGRLCAYVEPLLDAPGAEYYLEHRVVFPAVAGAFGTADLIVRIGNTMSTLSTSNSAPACAFSRSTRTATRTCHQRAAAVLRRGRAPLASRIFCRRRQHRPDHPAAAVDRARRRNGVLRRGHARRA